MKTTPHTGGQVMVQRPSRRPIGQPRSNDDEDFLPANLPAPQIGPIA